ncbi:hypothetical protein FB45DRAFT_938218 [Roridomyces roridus]|uniref:Uncharacterized protein n=1 Tax=Roridomyces roridus TaxID=1738132 RepID=A0AAD7B8K4_9AGAR|nr:hypothetical protein FB45DRAFT_938218 [Roridomyces roridus]
MGRSEVGGVDSEFSEEQIVDIHGMTREGLTLTVAVLPADLDLSSSFPREKHPELSPSPSPSSKVHPDAIEEASKRRLSEPPPTAVAESRRQFLEDELRRAQEQMVDVDNLTERSPTSSRQSLATILGSPTRQNSGADEEFNMAELLQLAREKNTALTERIEALEMQMRSAWALGLSDEPPPGYSN